MNAKEVFEREWALYRQGAAQGAFVADDAKSAAKGEFDSDVKVGEYRIFADMKRPFVALIVEERGLSGWQIVPVSPFTVPASPREMLVGERVLQLWNSCVASRRFVERSWRVDSVSEADLADVKARMAVVVPGLIAAGGGVVAKYEKAFLVSGGNFVPLVEGKPKRSAGIWRRYGGWSIAAMLMICLGATWMLYQEQLKSHEALRLENIRRVKEGDAEVRAQSYQGEMLEEAVVECEEPAAEPQVDTQSPVAASCPAPRKAKAVACCESVVVIKSPVTMRCVYGSVSPGERARRAPVRELPMPDGYGTERYAEYRENEFQNPKSAPLSTFSLDVDTSSYTLMRRYLTDQKRLPPRNSVRLEEYVNYFRYSYLQPQGNDPIAVNCELAECPWNKEHKLLRLGVQAKKLEGNALPPCNLTFLVDRSGSMNGNNGMELLKSGLKMLVTKLRDEDHVSIVTYADGTDVLLGSTPGSQKAKILGAIDSLRAGGCTYGSGGIQLAYEQAARNFDKKANNRVILVTDGDFNVGISSPKELEDFISSKRSSGIFLSVVGVGYGNYQDAKMKKLANAGNGNYAYLDSVLEAKKVMVSEFGGTLFTVAKDVKVQIEFNPAQVSGYRLLGYENRLLKAKDFNDDKKDAGEIGSGHTMTAFYEIVPADAEKPAAGTVDPLKYQKSTTVESAELFTVKMRWKAPDGDESKLKEIAWRAADITRPEASVDFRFASAVAEFALLLEGSKFKGDSSYKDVIERARAAKGADEEGYRAEFIRLVETAELLKDTARREESPSPSVPRKEPSVEVEVDI
ncbi:MAG: VWA domain-containing protein [Kiritimatiellae bacterium]|nr:VWA domain-containing protein [Kiritimatiellia bacterium]